MQEGLSACCYTQRPDVEDPDFYLSDDEDDPMNEVFCVECGRGDDEHSLLLCDGEPCILWSPFLHALAFFCALL